MLTMKVLYFWYRTGVRSFYQESSQKAKVIGLQREECPHTSLWLLSGQKTKNYRWWHLYTFSKPPTKTAARCVQLWRMSLESWSLTWISWDLSFISWTMLTAITVGCLMCGPAFQVAVMECSWNVWIFRTHSVVKGLVTERKHSIT